MQYASVPISGAILMNLRLLFLPALSIFLGVVAEPAPVRALCTYSYQCSMYIQGNCSEHTMTKTCTPDAPPPPYGAIAYGRESGASGWAYNQGSASQADQVALKYCAAHGDDCEIVVRLTHSCGAVAAGGGDTVTSGTGSTRDEAQNAALSACRSRAGESCEIQAWTCSP